jgi:hypothetical protein
VKGETLMEYEIRAREMRSAKRTLTSVAVYSAVICSTCAMSGVIADSQIHDRSNPVIGLFGVGVILG